MYDHAGVLFSNITRELAMDALTHDNPRNLEIDKVAKTYSENATCRLQNIDIIELYLWPVIGFYNTQEHSFDSSFDEQLIILQRVPFMSIN